MRKTDVSESSSNEQHDYVTAIQDLNQKVENMFQRLWRSPFHHEEIPDIFPYVSLRETPKMDIIDRDKEIVVKAELPGIDKKDLDISITNNQLVIRAKTCHEEKEEKGDYLKQEISKNEIYRSVLLPADVSDELVSVLVWSGVITAENMLRCKSSLTPPARSVLFISTLL